jgi:hypothetical protein
MMKYSDASRMNGSDAKRANVPILISLKLKWSHLFVSRPGIAHRIDDLEILTQGWLLPKSI